MTYQQIGQAYQASLNAFKAKLVEDGLSEEQASAFKSQAITNGSISSVVGVADEAVKAEREAESLAETNQRMEDKMAGLDALDDAKWMASQAVIAEHEEEAEAAKQKVLEDFRKGEQAGYTVTPAKKEPYDWLKKLNPPSWLSISGDANFEKNLFSDKYIGVTNLNRGIGEILCYEEQNLKVSISEMGTRNPNGVVDINVTSGDLTLSMGNYEFFANPFDAAIGITMKTPSINNPNIYREDTLAHDWDFNWGWTTNSIVTSRTNVTIDTKLSSEGFQVEQRNTVEGEVRTVKTTGIALATVAVVAFIEVAVGGLTLEGVLVGAASILEGAKGILVGAR
jgi:hypothetical protein